MFITSYKLKDWLIWPPIRSHLCTFAVALSFNSTWRIPRHAFRYGGFTFGLIVTVCMVTVALPITLLQLAIGQLSQQDAVGVWTAVPFFKGVGYIRVLISFLGSIHSIIAISLVTTYFFYMTTHSIPFWECKQTVITDDNNSIVTINASACFKETFLAPVSEKPEYYIALALVLVFLSVLFPFVLFSQVKLMKRIFYILGPLVAVTGITISSSLADAAYLSTFYESSDFMNFLRPNIWHAALVQSLMSSQTTGGYLILAGDSIYSSTNIQWTSLGFVGANIVAAWAGLLFWYAISGTEDKDTSPIAVLVRTYGVAVSKDLDLVWPLLTLIMLFLSGTLTVLTLLYPVYERCRRVGGTKWRYVAVAISLLMVAVALVTLAGGLPALAALEDFALPALISVAAVLEIIPFVLIYGWKALVEDIEFLIGQPVKKYWVVGWFAAPVLIAPFFIWWMLWWFTVDPNWTTTPWESIVLVTAVGVALAIFLISAAISVVKQVHYDAVTKLQSSFRPSRHWGPRDPITHYHWLSRREHPEGNLPRTTYRRHLGQFSGNTNYLVISTPQTKYIKEVKRRSNSDDWLYTVYRKKYLEELYPRDGIERKKRSKSLDWSLITRIKLKVDGQSQVVTPPNGRVVETVDPLQQTTNNIAKQNTKEIS